VVSHIGTGQLGCEGLSHLDEQVIFIIITILNNFLCPSGIATCCVTVCFVVDFILHGQEDIEKIKVMWIKK
jgi:uncharacterized membrane protein YtjA (UPF0391 family)